MLQYLLEAVLQMLKLPLNQQNYANMINVFLTPVHFFHKRRQCDVIAATSCTCLYQKAYSMSRYIYMYTCLPLTNARWVV